MGKDVNTLLNVFLYSYDFLLMNLCSKVLQVNTITVSRAIRSMVTKLDANMHYSICNILIAVTVGSIRDYHHVSTVESETILVIKIVYFYKATTTFIVVYDQNYFILVNLSYYSVNSMD